MFRRPDSDSLEGEGMSIWPESRGFTPSCGVFLYRTAPTADQRHSGRMASTARTIGVMLKSPPSEKRNAVSPFGISTTRFPPKPDIAGTSTRHPGVTGSASREISQASTSIPHRTAKRNDRQRFCRLP